jgi:hypothetical protein
MLIRTVSSGRSHIRKCPQRSNQCSRADGEALCARAALRGRLTLLRADTFDFLSVLARQAYTAGRITENKAVWAAETLAVG